MPFTIPTPSFLRRSGSSSSLSSPKKNKSHKIKINVESATQQQQPSPSPSPTNSELSSSTSLFTKGAVKSNQSNSSNSNLNVLPKQREAITPPPLSIPKLNTSNLSGSGSSNTTKFPLSPRSRQLSDRVRAAPSSLVRQLRSYSNSISSFSYMNDNSDPTLNSPKKFKLHSQSPRKVSGHELIKSNKQMMDTLPPELQPVVTLINAQKLRTYAVGTFQVPGIDENGRRVWIEVEGKLTGNELAIWRPSEEEFLVDMADEFKPRYINLTDVKLEWGAKDYDYDLKISQTFDEAFLIKFNDPEDLNVWSAAICLSNLEYTSLNEAFTAVILSLKGSKLSDIHILLSQKKRFAKNEWCNLRIPQISSKWLKLYVSIIPQEGKKKNGRIEIYLNEKMSKKNLILYVNKLYDVYNVYPEQPNMIDFNTIMKLDGEIHINKNFQYLFEKNSAANMDALSPPSRVSSFAFKSHSRTGSGSSFSSVGGFPRSTTTSSFFTNAPSPTKDLFAPSSPSSGIFKKADLSSKYAVTNCLYLMPVTHPGVSGMETMIRNFIDIIDAFKLFGRPSHLYSDKTEKRSMLFGLPSLPHYKYLSMEEAVQIVKKSFKSASQENWEGHEWRNAFKSFLNDLQLANGFKGHGDLYRLYESFDNLEIDDADYGLSSVMGSPQIKLPNSLVMPEFEGSDENVTSPHPLAIQQDRDLIIDTYLSEPTYSLQNSGGSGTNLYEDTSSGSGLGSPLGFSERLKAAAQKASSTNLSAQAQSGSEHPYYYMVNKSAELNKA